VKIALSDARIGFAGPAVILNTMCEANQTRFDNECPPDFQSAGYVYNYGKFTPVPVSLLMCALVCTQAKLISLLKLKMVKQS
jgi:hypothetical protein